jgi:hypothetical protein
MHPAIHVIVDRHNHCITATIAYVTGIDSDYGRIHCSPSHCQQLLSCTVTKLYEGNMVNMNILASHLAWVTLAWIANEWNR